MWLSPSYCSQRIRTFRNNRQARAKVSEAELADIDSVEAHSASVRFTQAEERQYERALACAGSAGGSND